MKRKIFSSLLTLVLALSLSLVPALPAMAAQAPVDLGSAGSFVILAESGISTTGTTSIVGDIGVSPITYAAITGFSLIPVVPDGTNTFSTSVLVTGRVYAADYTEPTPTNLGIAVLDMQAAYTDAAGRTLPDATELGAGNISGLTLAPGLYKWGTGVLIDDTGVTLSGGPDDVWIFQIAGTLTVSNGAHVILSGGAQAKNIFWAVADAVALGSASVFNGNILAKTNITMTDGATLNGRALAQTAVTLIANTITAPTTGVAPVQPPVDLGSAGNFAVLAGSTVTNTGATVVTGDLGVSPGIAVTGFLPGIVTGAIYTGDAIAAQSQLDLTTAYNNAVGQTVGAVAVAGNLGGQTLYPGLYKSTSSLEISSGDLTLDAQGDVNAVFIFQMASTLTTTSGRQVILTNGAKASNVYWQVGSSATLGTYSVFKGNILAYASITLNTGATLEGRALAQVGAVTLDTNTITVPTP